jgi:hypothetical protein
MFLSKKIARCVSGKSTGTMCPSKKIEKENSRKNFKSSNAATEHRCMLSMHAQFARSSESNCAKKDMVASELRF